MIVLDTQAFVWMAISPERLTTDALGALELEDDAVISTLTVYELAYLSMRGRIELDRPVNEWVADALLEHEFGTVAPDVAITARAGSISDRDFHGDPADRVIYATAVERGARLVSADRRLRDLDPARVVW